MRQQFWKYIFVIYTVTVRCMLNVDDNYSLLFTFFKLVWKQVIHCQKLCCCGVCIPLRSFKYCNWYVNMQKRLLFYHYKLFSYVTNEPNQTSKFFISTFHFICFVLTSFEQVLIFIASWHPQRHFHPKDGHFKSPRVNCQDLFWI